MDLEDSLSPDTTGFTDETDFSDNGGPDPAMSTTEEDERAPIAGKGAGEKNWRRGRGGRRRMGGKERRAYLPTSFSLKIRPSLFLSYKCHFI
jgi:hypothetical protein